MTGKNEYSESNQRIRLVITQSTVQSSSDYPAPDTPAIPIQRHFFEMIRSEKKTKKVQVPSVQ